MKISQSSVDIHKNALYAIAVNSIQIVAAVVLAALLFQLFRPMPKYDGSGGTARLEAEKSLA